MSDFKLLELTVIQRGALLGRAKLAMPSGLIIACNILLDRKDPDKCWVATVGEKTSGGYLPIVEFADPSVRDRWQAAAQAAIAPRLQELLRPNATANDQEVTNYAPF